MTSILITFAAPSRPVSSSLATAAQPAATSNQFDNDNNGSGLHKISTIMPAFLIGFVCFLAIFLACGMFHTRRRRRMRELNRRTMFIDPIADVWEEAHLAAQRHRKKKKRVVKPKLWEVGVKTADWERDLEALLPVAVELQQEPKPSPPSSPAVVPQEQSRKRWFFPYISRSPAPQHSEPQPQPLQPPADPHEPSMQQAQVAFIVSMPTPNRAPGQPSHEILLGTTRVPYREDLDDNADDLVEEYTRKLEYGGM